MSKLSLIVFFLFVLNLQKSYSQNEKSTTVISGKVMDSVSHHIVEYSSIQILDEKENVLVSSFTDTLGIYRMTVAKTGKVKLVFTMMGFLDKTINLSILPNQSAIDLHTIYLIPDPTKLNEVQVTSRKKLVTQKPGMLIYNAGNDPSNKGGNASDVLRKAPVLSVDARGNVSMRGSGNIKILVNGKYSGQMARNSADALNMMPADIIQSIEVITTPSAKYDAEGAAGVINIITKKGGKQFNGALEAAVSNWEQVFNPRVALSHNKWTINANAHLHRLRMKDTKDYERINYENNAVSSTLNQNIVNKNVAPHGSASVTVDYAADSVNQLSLGVTTWFGNWPDNSQLTNRLVGANGSLIEQYNQTIKSRGKYLGADINIGYTHKFKHPGQELTLLAQLSPSRDHSRYTSNQTGMDDLLLYKELNNSITKNKEWTFQADYVQPIGRSNKYTFEGGAKVITRNVKNDYEVFGSTNAQPDVLLPIDDRTNLFDYKQDVVAGYAIFKFNLPQDFYVETGARIEGTFLKGNFISGGNSFSKKFNNIVPTATISKRIDNSQTLSLSYTKRLTRPYIWDLNPNTNTSNAQSITTGNPDLNPEIAHQGELAYSWSSNTGIALNPAFFYKKTNNSIEDITTIRPDGVSVTSKQNLASNKQFGLNLSASMPIGNKMSINTNSNVSRLDFKSAALNIVSEGWGAEFNINATYKLPNDISLQAFSSYNTRTITLQGHETRKYYYSFAAKKEIKSQKLTLTLATVNPFTKAVGQNVVVQSSSFYSNSYNREYSQSVKFTAGWEFGSLFKQKEIKRIKNDDVKGLNKG